MTVRLDVSDGLATIALARPDAHNALDVATKRSFQEAVDRTAANTDVRAVLITAEGKNFCVGQDLGEHVSALEADPSTAMDTVGIHYNPLIRALTSLVVPVVVAVPGACVGAGLGIALAGDIRVAGTRSSFATAFTGIGLASDSGLSYSLVEALGSSRAGALMLLGDKITAEQAHMWGLVHRVVPDDEVRDTALALARQLADGPTEAFREVKKLVRASALGLDDALDRELGAQKHLGRTSDHKAAVDAFLAKRKPVFTGR
ncbi:enoyl-CoA hydratase/isomerase family protein [Rhodococcus sp. BP-252]|uniref:enoyl-CoA hydratase-related protein n=1 Tax=unclassified Rhodococcus (in: high G+C Gram-positive bacteria) TaxID=192944 RepID=UPI001C9AA08D|nr:MULTISPECIES: enoyl-CoA hydratase-related protein [unclassified Rhodococcus (in: high G+C Gram-positive bacteria)]MBY6412835.1 enoyl-CoA hydratase/isomerase family protein [Rhodococcus sp. BP-320]MBY6417628.1 enoyl-CoA hydratase/isomerase family protein [Rhodococcus sp. BP-321]MBY6423480.1 enoyl-CoA hydratase/isomerase family protein [Rhodococcus sp. BP-324]MBY6427652.1 enoyl-CoA hydratase/isomerase family protein [Rhodococcus sp. BP-323]MBY6432816.1 enoyl-CoA hydratase/isomerase family pro